MGGSAIDRKRVAVIAVGIIFLALFLGSWFATQYVASAVKYDRALGSPSFYWGDKPVYLPHRLYNWKEAYQTAIPKILHRAQSMIYLSGVCGVMLAGFIASKIHTLDTHGTASWAKLRDMKRAGILSERGVILGLKPRSILDYLLGRRRWLRHDGPEHILLMAPTRSGKGVGVIIPTCITWAHSMFIMDVKKENWQFTAGYRRKCLGNRVLMFDPLAEDKSSVRYNPLAEIRFGTSAEIGDVMNICDIIVDPDGKAKLDHWGKTAHTLLTGAILHLLYAYSKENRGVPSLTDVVSFLSSPERPFDEQMDKMKNYAHITPEEFFAEENPLERIYGEYITDFLPFREQGYYVSNLRDLKRELLQAEKIDFSKAPYSKLLSHPKIAEVAAEMLNKEEEEASGVLSTALSFLGLYRDPVVAYNTAVSEFCVMDLLDPKQPVSLYLVISPAHLSRLRPLVRLLINIILRRLTERMDFDKQKQKQRLLLLLDEFPQFGRIDAMETALAVMAGYGMKALVVCQDKNQLDKTYTKENSIVSNCHVRVFFTPNEIDSASFISKTLGKQTIQVASENNASNLFKSSTSLSMAGRELLTPEEVMLLNRETKEIVFVAGEKPVLADKLRYYQDPYFMERTFPNVKPPAVSDTCLSPGQSIVGGERIG